MLSIPEAFLIHEQTIYVPKWIAGTRAQTPVTALIEGVCAQFPDQARIILRERIVTKVPLTSRCEGMIRVAAKRASVLSEDEFSDRFLAAEMEGKAVVSVSPAPTPRFDIANAPTAFLNLDEAVQFALKLKAHSKTEATRSLSDRNVGAVLLGKENQVLVYAWNTNGSNRTQHAELNLIRSFLEKGNLKIPTDATLVVSLTPCAMCAAQIVSIAESISSLKVIYLEDDPGPKSKNSVLVKDSELWKKYGEPKIQLIDLKDLS